MKTQTLGGLVAAGLSLGVVPTGALAAEITLHSLNDAIRPVVAQFEAENPGDKINVQVVSYQSVLEGLPIQLASGEAPDISIVTDLGGLSKYYLDLTPYVDPAFFEEQYGSTLPWLRGIEGGNKIYGVPDSLTVNGAFVNVTLFEQAGIELPGEGATWDDWAAATKAVAEATGTDFPMEIDRSGHRFASLAISEGAELVDAQGKPVIDEGLKRAIEKFVKWHEDGILPMDLWGAVGGAAARENFADFVNAKTVLYFAGSWQLAKIDAQVAGLFDWKVVDAPCGTSSCTVMPGGGAMAGFKSTKQPELVGRFLNYYAQIDNQRGALQRAANLPTAKALVESGMDYPEMSPAVNEAMASFIRQIPKMAPAAYRFQGWPFQRAMMNAMTTRVSQVINHELDIDTALARIGEDVNLAIEAAGAK